MYTAHVYELLHKQVWLHKTSHEEKITRNYPLKIVNKLYQTIEQHRFNTRKADAVNSIVHGAHRVMYSPSADHFHPS